ncbi:ankyrin and armadillo repeat-containing [Brachionus plicatilis]|uniref:Ankyrin and armadillo repeat-containing n=1 Tax=Brachionus plicatilis TaxID=10195 RepID=A0A3M7S4H5_BRAPC|nr:ankyrin and armadillo repeat-containing [Brachionus plicatilis]
MNGSRPAPSSKLRDAATRKHTASVISMSSSNYEANPVHKEIDEDQNLLNTPAVRNILGFDQRFDRVEEQELLAEMNCHWLLSIDDFKVPIDHPQGMITQMSPLNDNHMFLLVPFDEAVPDIDYRELHQIIRELTIGIYVLNQHPFLQLEANFDQSTSCQLPVAYVDTKLGQIMINTDYWLKALWHGSYFPREKRIKFTERWRQMIDVDANGIAQTKKSVFYEFMNSGLSDICKEPDYAAIFEDRPSDVMGKKDDSNSLAFGVGMTAANSGFLHGNQPASINMQEYSNMSENEIRDNLNTLKECADDVSVLMTFGLNSVRSYKNIYEIDSDYSINACVRGDNQKVDNKLLEKIKPILNNHENFLRENFEKKIEIKKNLIYLKIISFLTPFLIGLKRRMKIPDMNNLLPLMTGDDVQTERELPPLMLGSDFRTSRFVPLINQEKNSYFHLHGGIQFELETCPLSQFNLEKEYDKIASKSTEVLKSYLDSEQLQEYKIPFIIMIGVQPETLAGRYPKNRLSIQ